VSLVDLPLGLEQAAVARKRKSLPKVVQLSIFQRDNWLCHWCKRPVIFSPAFKLLESELRGAGFTNLAYYHPNGTRRDSPLLDELAACIDHVQAFSAGGTCSEENFRTACWKCNLRKNDAPLKTWEQREKRSPVKGKYGEPKNWDGMAALFMFLAERNPSQLTAYDKDWLKALRSLYAEAC